MFMGPFLTAHEVFYMKHHYMCMLSGTCDMNSRISQLQWKHNWVGKLGTVQYSLRHDLPVRPRPIRPMIQRHVVSWNQNQKEHHSGGNNREFTENVSTIQTKRDVMICNPTLSPLAESDFSLADNGLKGNVNIHVGQRESVDPETNSSEVRKSFSCPQCKYSTDRKNNLKRHIITMHFDCDRKLECCGASFRSKAKLREHVILFHKDGYRCMTCGRTFCRKALLRRHMAVHSGKKDFLCSLCDYATSHKSNLERHQKVHQKPKGLERCGNLRVYSQRKFRRTFSNDTVNYKYSNEYNNEERSISEKHDVYNYDTEKFGDFTEINNNQNGLDLLGDTTRQNVYSSSYCINYLNQITTYNDEGFDKTDTTDNVLGNKKDENDNNVHSNDKNNTNRNISEARNKDRVSNLSSTQANGSCSNVFLARNKVDLEPLACDNANMEDISCVSKFRENGYELAPEHAKFCRKEIENDRKHNEKLDIPKRNSSNIDDASFDEVNDLSQDDSDSMSLSDMITIKHEDCMDTNKESKRLCVQPYRCASCKQRFKSQAEFQHHVCYDGDENSAGESYSSYSLVAKIIKLGHV